LCIASFTSLGAHKIQRGDAERGSFPEQIAGGLGPGQAEYEPEWRRFRGWFAPSESQLQRLRTHLNERGFAPGSVD
jgi:hypothetical protein